MRLVLALDAGTTGVRAVAFDGDLNPLFDAYRELTQFYPAPGEVEHDPEEITRLALDVLRDVANQAKNGGHTIEALGITNQRETTIGFDRARGTAFHPAIVWQDRRTAPRCQELEQAGHGDLVRTTTGLVLDSYFSATKMQWMLERGHADRAEQPAFATLDSWLLWHLTGGVTHGIFATEPSNASRTMLLDITSGEWSTPLLGLFGISASMLASVQPSASHFGTVSESAVPELAGVPITGILGDQQAALFGQACFTPGLIKATYGTGAFVLANAGDKVPPVSPGLITTIAWDLGTHGDTSYALEGSAFVAGAAVQWLRDLGIIGASSDLEAVAQSVEHSAGVQFIPAFTGLGSPFWQPDARGAITGLTRAAGRGEIARALVEALAYQVRAMTDAFIESGLVLKELRADGGAAAMNLLLQFQATNSRCDVVRCGTLEATARGAASIAGLDAGVWSSLDELSTHWQRDVVFHPEDPTFADVGYQQWSRAVERA